MTNLLTSQEYADYRRKNNMKGATYQTVRTKVRQGKITCVNGVIDPDVADLQWKENTREASYPIADQTTPICPTDEDLPERALSLARIEAIKAIKEQLSLDELQGELVRVSDVYEELFDVINTLKSSLLLIPSRIAPAVASLNDITDIENSIEVEIADTLEQLSVRLSRSNIIKAQ